MLSHIYRAWQARKHGYNSLAFVVITTICMNVTTETGTERANEFSITLLTYMLLAIF